MEVARFLVLLLVVFSLAPAYGISSSPHSDDGDDSLAEFKHCLKQSQHRRALGECAGRTAINFLQRFEERDNFTLTSDLVSARDDKVAARSLVNMLDTDPVDFRGILENAGAVFSQRSLQWHMDAIYPGLMLKIGPTADSNSVAEFALDPAMDERNFVYDEPSTARILTKQYLLPFLLGLKFNLVALVPLLFATLCLLLKKSLFLAKLAIYVSSVLGVGGAVSAAGGLGGLGGLGGILGGAFGGLPPPIHPHGPFPGKGGFAQPHHYDEPDDFPHHSPYKRNDRKIHFEKPREYVNPQRDAVPPVPSSMPLPATAAPDRFYDYEKQILMQDRSGKLRTVQANGKLGPSAYEEDSEDVETAAVVRNFHTSGDRLGWKVVDLRGSL